MFLRRVFSEQYLYLQGLTQERSQNSRSYNRKRFEGDKQVITSMDFSHYFRWLFANFRERFLSS